MTRARLAKRDSAGGSSDPSKDFANYAQKRDAVIVVAVTMVTLVLVQGDYVGISHVLGDLTLLPAQAEELMKQLQDGLLPMLQNFRWILSFPGALPQARPLMAGNPGRALRAVSLTMFWVE